MGALEAKSQAALARTIAAEFARLGLPPIRLADWVREDRFGDANFVDGCHPSGTTRMAADPRDGVVDADCQVHGVDRLYVAGSSVFPTAGPCEPDTDDRGPRRAPGGAPWGTPVGAGEGCQAGTRAGVWTRLNWLVERSGPPGWSDV